MTVIEVETGKAPVTIDGPRLVPDYLRTSVGGLKFIERIVLDIGVNGTTATVSHRETDEDGKLRTYPDETGNDGLTNLLQTEYQVTTIDLKAATA